MKHSYLFPNRYKIIGWIFFIPSIIVGMVYSAFKMEWEIPWFQSKTLALIVNEMGEHTYFFKLIDNNIFDELLAAALVLSSLVIAFSKERNEDEFISRIRLESLVWATYVNYGILILAILFVYGLSFFWVLIFNMFTTLLFFIVHFNWRIHNVNKIEIS